MKTTISILLMTVSVIVQAQSKANLEEAKKAIAKANAVHFLRRQEI